MQTITPHLWFDKEAKEAAGFYVSAFGGSSRVLNVSQIDGTPSGPVDIVSFELAGQTFMGISAGPLFKHGTKDQIARVTQAFLRMKKFDLAALQRAYEGA